MPSLPTLSRSIIFFFLFFIFCEIQASTPLGGTFSSDTTLSIAGSPYEVTGAVGISVGATMTIEPGVEIQLVNSNAGIGVSGTLIAVGTISDSIKFNNGGSGQIGRHIHFDPGSKGTISYAIIDSIGIPLGFPFVNAAVRIYSDSVILLNTIVKNGTTHGILITDSGPIIQDCQVRNFQSTGISIRNATPTIDGCLISECVGGLTAIHGNSDAQILNCAFSSNTGEDIRVNLRTSENCHQNIAAYIGVDEGSIADTVVFPADALVGGGRFRKTSGQTFTVLASGHLTLEPGVTIEESNISVHGTLIADGMPGDSVYFHKGLENGRWWIVLECDIGNARISLDNYTGHFYKRFVSLVRFK